jgi:hypothetical protein
MYLVESEMFIVVTLSSMCTGKNVARSSVKEYGASSVLCKRTTHRIPKKFYTTVFVLLGGGLWKYEYLFLVGVVAWFTLHMNL